MGNSLNRQRYLMAQGYTYKVLVNITKGLDETTIEEITGMKQLTNKTIMQRILVDVGATIPHTSFPPC